jgi:hypothetical protein
VVYDYSSDIAGPELPWTAGQRRPTFIYRHVLELAPRSTAGDAADDRLEGHDGRG